MLPLTQIGWAVYEGQFTGLKAPVHLRTRTALNQRMPSNPRIYLDVETDWNRNLTVLAFHSLETGTVQLVGDEITIDRLRKILPRTGQLITSGGFCFDFPVIKKQLGIDLRRGYDAVDLRYSCRRCGLTGGQKAVERMLGVRRRSEGIDGRHAARLWNQYLRGDRDALRTLLRYNEEDLLKMQRIEIHVRQLLSL